MRHVWCTSTNYKMLAKKGTCELNKHDISLINENILNFHDQQGVTFSTLLKVM